MTQDRAEARWIRFGTPAALFLLAFVVRASPWREVFAAGHVVPPGNDVFYHLRRMVYAVARGASLDFDPYLNFPEGAKPIWPPLFDWVCAALVAPFVGSLEGGWSDAAQTRLETLAVWIPPLLGAGAVMATWALARRHWGNVAALVAGGVLALLSGHFWYSQLGFVDHHAAVALASVLLLGVALDLMAAQERGAGPRVWASAAWVGVWSAGCLLLWPGSLLHVGLVHLGLLLFLLSRPQREPARRLVRALAGSHGLALLLVAPSGLAAEWPQWSAMSPVVVSRFQPWLFALATVLLASCAALWGSRTAGGSAGRRAVSLIGLGVLLALASSLLLPELRDGAGDAWRWLAKRESFQSRVSESLPLLVDGGRFTLHIALVRLSGLVLGFPLALAWLLWRVRERPDRARIFVLALWSTGLLVTTLFQKRFFNSASIGVALVSGLVFAELWRSLGTRPHARGARLTLVCVLAVCLVPTLEPYGRHAANELRALRGLPHGVSGAFVTQAIAMETSRWLRENTPPTRGWLDAAETPEYGILAPWPLGHQIEYLGRRPTLVDNFGDDLGPENFAFADAYYRGPESPQRVDAARARGVRYVIVQPGASYLSRPPERGSLARALVVLDGAEAPGAPAVEHHRLVHESRGLPGVGDPPRALFKVYELVEAARLEGRAAPGAVVSLRLGVTSDRGRRFFYEATAVAGADGRYRFRLPYPTGGGSGAGSSAQGGTVRTAPLYRLRCGEEVRGVAVSLRAVRRGDPVAGPALCLDAS